MKFVIPAILMVASTQAHALTLRCSAGFTQQTLIFEKASDCNSGWQAKIADGAPGKCITTNSNLARLREGFNNACAREHSSMFTIEISQPVGFEAIHR